MEVYSRKKLKEFNIIMEWIKKEQGTTIFHCKSSGLFKFLYYVPVLLASLKHTPGKIFRFSNFKIFKFSKLNGTRLLIVKKVTNWWSNGKGTRGKHWARKKSSA